MAISYVVPLSRVHFPADFPPLFLNWYPLAGPELLVPLALGAALTVGAPRVLRLPAPALLAALVAFSFLFSVSLAVQSGRIRTFQGCCLPGGTAEILSAQFERRGEYYAAVPLVDELGPREFARRFPELDRRGTSTLPLHVTTHPPGAPMLLWALSRLTGGSVLAVSLLVVAIGALGVLPTYAVAREAYGDPVARVAALLYACSPGVIVYSATSMDVVFMTAIAVALAALVRASRSAAWAAVAGALTAVAMCLTWAAAVLGVVGLGLGLLARHRGTGWAELVGRGLVAVAALVATALLIRALTGIDLVVSFGPTADRHTHYLTYRRSYPYWAVGNIVALLITAGIAQTSLLVAETRERWRSRRPGLETVLWATLVFTSALGLFRGETDHNWLFFVPLVATVAAAAADRARSRGPVAGSLGQAIATEVLFYTGW